MAKIGEIVSTKTTEIINQRLGIAEMRSLSNDSSQASKAPSPLSVPSVPAPSSVPSSYPAPDLPLNPCSKNQADGRRDLGVTAQEIVSSNGKIYYISFN